ENLARLDPERDIVDDRHDAAVRAARGDAQMIDLYDGAHQWSSLAASALPGRLSITRFTAIVKIAIASAGAITDAPPVASAPRFSRTIDPQSAAGGCTPRPRKLRLASSRTA